MLQTKELNSIREKYRLGKYPDASERCQYPGCDGYGHVISVEVVDGRPYSCARPCPDHAARRENRHRQTCENKALQNLAGLVHSEFHRAIFRPSNLESTDSMGALEVFLSGIYRNDYGRLQAKRGLILCGSAGCGKSTAAIYAVAQCLRVNPYAKISIWPNFADLLNAFNYGDSRAGSGFLDQREYVKKQFESADLLLLDDVGRCGRSTELERSATREILFRAMSKAIEDRIPAIFIANVNYNELERIISGFRPIVVCFPELAAQIPPRRRVRLYGRSIRAFIEAAFQGQGLLKRSGMKVTHPAARRFEAVGYQLL